MPEVMTLEQMKAYIRDLPDDEIVRVTVIREGRKETEDE